MGTRSTGILSVAFVLGLQSASSGCGLLAGVDNDYTASGSVDGADLADRTSRDVSRLDGRAQDTSVRDDGSGDSAHDAGDVRDANTPDVAFVEAAVCGAESMCVDPVPSGWSGPVILADVLGGPPTPSPPACPSSYSNEVFTGYLNLTAPTAACACSCGALTGFDCDFTGISIALYQSTGCSGATCTTQNLTSASNFCIATDCMNGQSAIATEPLAQGGSCTQNVTRTIPTATWAETARVCQPSSVSGGCAKPQICVPLAPIAPFQSNLCILHSGNVPCPAGSYSEQKVFYASDSDTRNCAPTCACTPPPSAPCTGGVSAVYANNPTCSAPVQSVPADGTCYSFSVEGEVFAQTTTEPQAPQGGKCTAANSQPVGDASPSMPSTVCCQP